MDSTLKDVENPIILFGTKLNTGDVEAIILLLRLLLKNGKIKATPNSNESISDGTLLELKLLDLENLIGQAQLDTAIITFFIMLLNFVIIIVIGQLVFKKRIKTLVNILIIIIVVFVVEISESLPLAVTLALAL